MSLAGIEEEVLGGIILAIVLWCAGALFQWLLNRNRQITSLRKYERLRAKVEVLSHLASVELGTVNDPELEKRQREVLRSELTTLLDELEQDERDATEVTHLARMLQSLQFGPSRTVSAIVMRLVHYAVSFIALCILSLMILIMVDPPSTTSSNGSATPVPIGGAVCVSLPFVLFAVVTYFLALRIHKRQFVTARIVGLPRH